MSAFESSQAHVVVALAIVAIGTSSLLFLFPTRHFCAGADLAHALDDTRDEASTLSELHGTYTTEAHDAVDTAFKLRSAGSHFGGPHLLKIA